MKREGKPVETFEGLTVKRGKTNVATAVSAQSTLIRVEEVAKTGTIEKLGASSAALATPAAALVPAQSIVGPEDYVGSAADRTGFGGLEAIEEVTMVAVPDLMAAYQRARSTSRASRPCSSGSSPTASSWATAWRSSTRRPGSTPSRCKEWRTTIAGYDSK